MVCMHCSSNFRLSSDCAMNIPMMRACARCRTPYWMIRQPEMSFKGPVAPSLTDKRRGKGKRGGLRVIYFYWVRGLEFWLFTLYDKNE